MKINISSDKMITITHQREVLEFEEFKPQASWKFEYDELLLELNDYWSKMSSDEQDELFGLYTEISDVMLSGVDERTLMARLQTLVATIADIHHDLSRMRDYVSTMTIDYPSTVHEAFSSNENRKSRVGTYLRHEYDDLIALAIISRALMPIWMQFRELQRGADNEHRVFSDIAILQTLRGSRLLSSEPMVRLFDFIQSVYEKQDLKKTLGSVVAGIGTEEIPNYLYASSIINRLAIRPIHTTADNGTLVSTIHERVRTDVNKLGEKFQQMRERSETRMSDGEEDKSGYLESFSVRQTIADDIHITNGVYLRNYRTAKRHLDEDIPVQLVKACIDSLKSNSHRIILPIHRYLVQYVLYRTHNQNPEGLRRRILIQQSVPHLMRPEMIHAMGLAQAALIHWHLRDVAVLLSSKPIPLAEDDVAGISTPMLSIKTHLRDEIARIFPNFRPNGDKSPKNLYAGILAADNMIRDHIGDRRWDLKCSKTVGDALRYSDGEFIPSENMRNQLIELIIKINK